MSYRTIALRLAPPIAAGIPAVVLRSTSTTPSPVAAALLFGAAMVGASFLLAWAAEAAEHDVPDGVAVAIVALVAVLPEYAVDAYFAFRGGKSDAYRSFAAANMTGANRLLIGVGWALVVLITVVVRRQLARVQLEAAARIELGYLLASSALVVVVLIVSSIPIVIGAALLVLYLLYFRRLAKSDVVEPELVGTAAMIGDLRPQVRRPLIAVLITLATGFILLAAAPFADALLAAGAQFGIDRYLLVQWVAPLASEAPEFIVATLFAVRSSPAKALALLLSSKVVQWLALFGGLPIVFAIGGGTATGLPLDPRQRAEIALTLAQTVFGIALLLRLRIGRLGALSLFGLFAGQFLLTSTESRWLLAIAYIALALPLYLRDRAEVPLTMRATIGRVD